jgi:hypothetical protein
VVNLSSGIPSKGYLETGQFSLGDLDAALALEAGLVVSQASGPAMEFKLVGSTLYFLSPVQQFSDTASVVKFTNANSTKSWLVTLRWSGRVSPALSRISEADESGKAPPDLVTLLPNGVGPTGGVSASTTQGLSFTLQNAPATDPANSMISLHTSTGSQDVTSQFTYSNGKYTLAPAQLSNFLATVQTAKTASLSFSLSTPDDLKTFGFEQVLVSSGGTLQVGVVNAGGSPATEFAGVRFVARGFNSGFAVLGQLDANARVSFTGLPADTYDVTQVLLGPGIPLVGFGTLPSSNSFVSLTIIKVPGAVTQAGADGETTIEANAVASPFNFETAKAVILSDEPVTLAPRVPDLTFAPLAGTSGLAVASALDYAIAVTSGAADTLVTSPVSFIAPKGSTQLSVRVVVTSAEYPVFTGQQSKFNDIWLFNIQIPALARSLQQTGKVNQSHATSGTISFDTCLDLTSAATNADVSVTGQIGAQNVVDSLYPTSVSVSISLSCQGTLKLTQFSGKATTPDGLFSLFPRKKGNAEATPDGNVSGQYISIPRIVRLPSSFGIPATIQYAPADVTITGVEIFQRAGGQDVSLGANYLAQGNASKPGVIEFSGLLLDPTLVTPLSGQVQLVARLRGIRQGSAVVSDLVPLTVDDKYSSFTPIYLTNELTGYDNLRRFGSNHNEPGGDSWATFAMATWVFGEALPYNDVSAASVKQLSAPEYGSVLEHAGHSDAQQVDVRYWDGAGGFTDPLSGNNLGKGILDLALAALAEVNSNANPKVSLPRLVAWITENRTKIALYANRANVRRVHIGDAHIKQLLVDGRFPGSTTFVPGLSAQKWKQMGMPDKISWQDKHLDHWHISTYNP